MESRSGATVAQDLPAGPETGVSIARISYHGWADCYRIQNGCVEAIVVPAIGRVMQLRLAGEPDGAFWENRALDGQLHDPASNEWLNFGGDKCWPAPQSAWLPQQGRDWPPPAAFDSRPMEGVAGRCGIVLTSPVDSGFGIQVVRHVELDSARPVLRIRTEFRKLQGGPVRVGVWSITQMPSPERVCVLLPLTTRFPDGYVRLMDGEPAGLRIEGRLLTLKRHPHEFAKIGTEGSSLAWIGPSCVVCIEAESGPGEYPDGGCVTEIYTNPDPLQYVELETLGPLATLSAGDRIEQTTVYSVSPRSTPDPEAEASRVISS